MNPSDFREPDNVECNARREDAERALLGGEVHDELLPLLFVSSASVNRLISDLRGKIPDADAKRLQQVAGWLGDAMDTGRSLLSEILPPDFGKQPWQQAAKNRLDQLFQTRTAEITWQISEEAMSIGAEHAFAAMRITVEACRNSIRHGKADHIQINATNRGHCFELTIQDDGIGFDVDNVPSGHFGLMAMEARAKRIGGKISVQSRPSAQGESGTTVKLVAPSN